MTREEAKEYLDHIEHLKVSRDPVICHCGCHYPHPQHGFALHCAPCCYRCPDCGQRVVVCYSKLHADSCPANDPAWQAIDRVTPGFTKTFHVEIGSPEHEAIRCYAEGYPASNMGHPIWDQAFREAAVSCGLLPLEVSGM